jgi:TRAP transporter TAXI family solute receptor
LAATNGFELLPIEGDARDKLMAQFKFFAKDKIPDGIYKDVKGVDTVAVGAQWTTSSKQPEDLVYEITKALWSDKTRTMLDSGHAKGKDIRRETALLGVGIPLHAGAEKFYKEAGLLK